jgi:hypothetical protein
MYWTILLGVLLYFAIGCWFMKELDSYDGGGKGSCIVAMIWPFIALLWVMVMVLVVVPDWIVKRFKYRRDK